IGPFTPVPPRGPASSPEVTCCSSVPCRPQTPWCKWVNESAFVSIVQTRPAPPLADRFILGFPIDYGPDVLLMLFGFLLGMDTLPSGGLLSGGFMFALGVSGFRFRARLAVSIPSAFSG